MCFVKIPKSGVNIRRWLKSRARPHAWEDFNPEIFRVHDSAVVLSAKSNKSGCCGFGIGASSHARIEAASPKMTTAYSNRLIEIKCWSPFGRYRMVRSLTLSGHSTVYQNLRANENPPPATRLASPQVSNDGSRGISLLLGLIIQRYCFR